MSLPPLTLAAGQCHWLRLRAGSRLIVRRGELVLHEPLRWLGEQPCRLGHRLVAHCPHTLAEGGWVTLVAQRGCELRIEAPPAPLAAARAAWRGALARLPRRLPG